MWVGVTVSTTTPRLAIHVSPKTTCIARKEFRCTCMSDFKATTNNK